LAIGCCVYVGDKIVEDGAWLEQVNDVSHDINVAEVVLTRYEQSS